MFVSHVKADSSPAEGARRQKWANFNPPLEGVFP